MENKKKHNIIGYKVELQWKSERTILGLRKTMKKEF